MIQSQKDALKFKSKIYQFIHSEILEMKRDFNKRTGGLEKENLFLKNEIKILTVKNLENAERSNSDSVEMANLNEKLNKMKNSILKYNREITNKIEIWKKDLEQQVRVYLEKSRNLK